MYPTNQLNDFYLRQSQPYQQTFNFPPNPQPSVPQIKANWVSSIEEAKASQIDFVSTNIFLDTASGNIYLKRIGDNGKPQFITYIIEEDVKSADPLSEINSRLSNIESVLGGLKNESIPGNAGIKQSEPVPYPTITKQNERHDETKPTGVSENAGNGWRKK